MIGTCIIAFVIGTCFGVIPFSYLIAQMRGTNLRRIGSGNIGATNLGRAMGLPFFIIGLVLDGLKGFVPVILAQNLAYPGACAGAGAILGHIFNPFFTFRGGKGVSTTIGVACALVPRSFSIALAVWVVAYITTTTVSLASLVCVASLVLVSFILAEATLLDRVFIVVMAAFIVIAHRSNIKRLLSGHEPKTKIWTKE
jgi:glycerol-3-phosphate acyltransferase PlsY